MYINVPDIGGDEEECTCDDPEKECINIPIPKNDIQYDEEEKTCFSVKRSLPVAKGGELGCKWETAFFPTQQYNKNCEYCRKVPKV